MKPSTNLSLQNAWAKLPSPIRRNRVGVMRCSWPKVSFSDHCRLATEVGCSFIEDFAHNLATGEIDEDAAKDAPPSASAKTYC